VLAKTSVRHCLRASSGTPVESKQWHAIGVS
jgi:hypothetical protein